MVITLQFLIMLTESIETKYEFDVKDDTFNKVMGKRWLFINLAMTSDLLHKATHFMLTISSSFQSQRTLFWELFKWEENRLFYDYDYTLLILNSPTIAKHIVDVKTKKTLDNFIILC